MNEMCSAKPPTEDEAPMLHQNFDCDDLADRLSSHRSALSKRSQQRSAILKSVTPSSKSALVGGRSQTSTQGPPDRFKSNAPHVSLNCARFESLEQGWLFKKFDTNASNKALINGFDQVALFAYDTRQLDFQFRPELLRGLFDFFSAVALFGDSKPNLFAVSCFSDKSLRLEDLEKLKNVSVVPTKLDSQVTTINARNSLIDAGTCDSVVAVFDIRSGKRCLSRTLPGASEFNPVVSMERSENLLACSTRDGTCLLDVRNIGGQFLVEQQAVNGDSGVNVARFVRAADELQLAVTQIGSKTVRLFDTRRSLLTDKTLKTKRKILSFAFNRRDNEIAVLEGSEKPSVTFFDADSLALSDQLAASPDCIDIKFSADSNSLITFGTKACQVYCFDSQSMVQSGGTEYKFD